MAFKPFNWTCPHCAQPQSVTEPKFHQSTHPISVTDLVEGALVATTIAVGCANDACGRLTLIVQVAEGGWSGSKGSYHQTAAPIFSQRLIPESGARPQPDYIPAPLLEDYQEACRIRDLSPKASATLSRRCLQGMIRDFCRISKAPLDLEIKALRAAVDDGGAPAGVTAESVEAIDQVRGIGNIGAHMEKDINVILPVDPDEAQMLIELIELLFQDWYVARHRRQERLNAIAATADEKKALRQAAAAAASAPPAAPA